MWQKGSEQVVTCFSTPAPEKARELARAAKLLETINL